MWILPRIDKWNEQRNAHRREGERQLQVRNYSEALRTLERALEIQKKTLSAGCRAGRSEEGAAARKRAREIWKSLGSTPHSRQVSA